MKTEFYFRRETDTSPWMIKRLGGYAAISYHASYQNIKLEQDRRLDYVDWLSITKSKRKRLFSKYSNIPESNGTIVHFIGVNFTTEEDPVYQTVPQTPQLNAMCDYISTQAVSIGSTAYHRGDLSESLCIPATARTDLVIMDDVSSNKTKKGNTMYFDDEDCDCCENRPGLPPEKRYLLSRTNSIEGMQRCKIPATYHLEDDPTPMTANDLLQRIKDGKFIVRKDKGDEVGGWPTFPLTFIEWRDPAVTKDVAGADKAREALETAVTKTMDTIVAGDVAAGLSAVQALEAQTF